MCRYSEIVLLFHPPTIVKVLVCICCTHMSKRNVKPTIKRVLLSPISPIFFKFQNEITFYPVIIFVEFDQLDVHQYPFQLTPLVLPSVTPFLRFAGGQENAKYCIFYF